jgi:hypothetical protein
MVTAQSNGFEKIYIGNIWQKNSVIPIAIGLSYFLRFLVASNAHL